MKSRDLKKEGAEARDLGTTLNRENVENSRGGSAFILPDNRRRDVIICRKLLYVVPGFPQSLEYLSTACEPVLPASWRGLSNASLCVVGGRNER